MDLEPTNPIKIRSREIHRQFLLSLFPNKENKFAVTAIGNFVLVRAINGNNQKPYVMIYTKESFQKAMNTYKKIKQH